MPNGRGFYALVPVLGPGNCSRGVCMDGSTGLIRTRWSVQYVGVKVELVAVKLIGQGLDLSLDGDLLGQGERVALGLLIQLSDFAFQLFGDFGVLDLASVMKRVAQSSDDIE